MLHKCFEIMKLLVTEKTVPNDWRTSRLAIKGRREMKDRASNNTTFICTAANSIHQKFINVYFVFGKNKQQ